MDKLKNHYVALATGGIAVVLGFISKRALSLQSVSAGGIQQAITSFVVVAASVKGAEYFVTKEEHKG